MYLNTLSVFSKRSNCFSPKKNLFGKTTPNKKYALLRMLPPLRPLPKSCIPSDTKNTGNALITSATCTGWPGEVIQINPGNEEHGIQPNYITPRGVINYLRKESFPDILKTFLKKNVLRSRE